MKDKKFLISFFIFLSFSFIIAQEVYYFYLFQPKKRPYKDFWGNSYQYYDNLFKDSDNDGIYNFYDYNDKKKNVSKPSDLLYEEFLKDLPKSEELLKKYEEVLKNLPKYEELLKKYEEALKNLPKYEELLKKHEEMLKNLPKPEEWLKKYEELLKKYEDFLKDLPKYEKWFKKYEDLFKDLPKYEGLYNEQNYL
ncbi:MAG: hypothetical protein NC926_08810 [Candidatus Omnitrophica bacterium]|nr:hypothetical protein [Candidatus Omnitrophota bacterium]